MHRFYLPPENCRGDLLRLDGREAHHALHVLRLKHGERVTVLNGAGSEFFCEVENSSKDSLSLAVKEKKITPAPSCPVTLLVAIPKGKIIEDIIQKSVELGVSRIVPLLTERVISQLDRDGAEQKREKWQHVAIEAIKQCGATWLPEVETPQTIANFLRNAELRFGKSQEPRHADQEIGAPLELSLVGSLQTERRHPRNYFRDFQKQHRRLPHSAGVWIGPEGDFTLTELQQIQGSGALPITLGDLTLRVETAAIYCLAVLNYELSAQP